MSVKKTTSKGKGLASFRSNQILKAVVGTTNPFAVIVIILYLFSLSIFIDVWKDSFAMFFFDGAEVSAYKMYWYSVVFICISMVIFVLAQNSGGFKAIVSSIVWSPEHDKIGSNDVPEKVHGLIVFLSNPDEKNKKEIKKMIERAKTVNFFEEEYVEPLTNSRWRMALESIKYHYPVLEKIIVIPSADSGKSGEVLPGSHNDLSDFVDLVYWLVGKDKLEVSGLISYDKGVDYEDLGELTKAAEEAFNILKDRYKLNESEILIDVTSGTKIATIAGSIVALGGRRKIQYVSNSYSINTYDVEYESF